MPENKLHRLKAKYTPAEAKGMFVYLEHSEGEFADVSLELISKAKEITNGESIYGMLFGHKVNKLAEKAIRSGLDEVYVIDDEHLLNYTPEAFIRCAEAIVEKQKPDTILIGATQNGCDMAGGLAVRLQTGLTAHITDLEVDEDGELVGWVPGFGGGIAAACKCPRHRPQLISVRPGVFLAGGENKQSDGKIHNEPVPFSATDIKTEIVERKVLAIDNISKVDRIVAVGRGTDGDLGIAEELAETIGGKVGGTRVALDEGWIRKEQMIGQTGYSTKPNLAVLCGISGATQFTIGIDKADLILAINNDEEAPIFEQADLCVVDDLFDIVPALTKVVKNQISR